MDIVVYCLAVYGLSWSLVNASGPWDILSRFRHWTGVSYDTVGERYGTTVVSNALNCPICTSYWVSIPLLAVLLINVLLLYPLAAIGLVTFITELINAYHG